MSTHISNLTPYTISCRLMSHFITLIWCVQQPPLPTGNYIHADLWIPTSTKTPDQIVACEFSLLRPSNRLSTYRLMLYVHFMLFTNDGLLMFVKITFVLSVKLFEGGCQIYVDLIESLQSSIKIPCYTYHISELGSFQFNGFFLVSSNLSDLPVEVIGNILSQLTAARDVVIASATCKKWREAWRNHLHTLSFNSNDWPVYHDLTTSRLEILITQTIFQTTVLQCLSITMDDVDEFSAAPVIAWLMYTRETLCQLHYNVRTSPNVNVIEKCGRQRLELLSLAHNSITDVEPSYQKFPCLKSLSLSNVSISALDLSHLLTACPKLETLALINPDIAISDAQSTMGLSSPSLKEVYVEAIGLDKFILEVDSLEVLHLKGLTVDSFELINKGSLRVLKIDDVNIMHVDFGDNIKNLEVVDVSSFTIMGAKFYHMISKSSKLRRLRLWGVLLDDEEEVVDLDMISICFPQLTHLSISYDSKDGVLHCGLLGSSRLENVVRLELGWTVLNDIFPDWVAGFLEKCPNLKKLVIYGVVSETKTHEECQILANFTSYMVQLMRKYMQVEVQIEFE